ncbi:corticosteroid 11-beta-dehydrogenase isozyme 2 [Sander lucioperca]|uniref:corticosteroid 11-beta-dehydrogenase isozyme 2 n=1 Tax=Sander lucioperca TaxID=283035 RepID=UPI0016538C99|nr:corticosteroid 11-beta-dehydrogenase isozyme 2 [Sander lucioperca]XP_035855709.1 corticosteroid 11-beta-dehydrogenase isozyme 2 [Sander lucioperca]
MMDDYFLPSWIYLAVFTVFVGGATKKILACQLSAAPPLMALLGATVLAERLWALCLPALLLLVPLALTYFLYFLYSCTRAPPATLPAQGKAVLITGCDSGFGNATAKHLDALGFEVFATVLDGSGDGARDLQKTCSPRLTILQVDITQPQQVQQALIQTKAKLGLKGLWGLVNNAGVCVNFGDAELSLMSTFRGCMEVNFFGTLSVTQTFLPLLRHARGRIITVSSPAGDQPFPCLAAYGASKAALNLLMNTLRNELQPWGVPVSTVLPASFRTGQSGNRAYWETQHTRLLQSLSPALLDEYGEDYVSETKDLFQSHASHANPDLSPVVVAITTALQVQQPAPRYFAGPGVGLMYFIHSYCPLSVSGRFLQKLFVKKKLPPRALRKQADCKLSHGLHNNNNNNNDEDSSGEVKLK